MDKNNTDILITALQKIAIDNRESLSRINTQTLRYFNSEDFKSSVNHLSELMMRISNNYRQSNDSIQKALTHFADSYKTVLNSTAAQYDFDAIYNAMLKISLSTSAVLTQANHTPMIKDLIKSFAQADYIASYSIINQNLKKSIIRGSDIAFLKASDITTYSDTNLELPRGLKTSLETLNKSAAFEIIDNRTIGYDTNSNHFIGSDSMLKSKAVNVACDGKYLFGVSDGDELFSEEELMNFISFLSRTPMLGAETATGKKILKWIGELFSKGTYSMDFDHDIYYHCRSRKAETMPYSYEEMLRAPYGLPAAGRFNQTGRAHFYFADSREGAETEVKKHLKKDELLQTTKIKPVKRINMLDLSGTIQRGKSFLKYIRYPLSVDSNKMPKEYLLPCFVTDCCKQIGFDGIKYYGSKEYSNYVSWHEGYFEDAGMCSLG